MSFRFTKKERIGKKEDFNFVFNNGTFIKSVFSFTVVFVPNSLDYSRIGIIVKKKYGCAVKRNYQRRIIKEAFRLNKHLLHKFNDIIFITKNLSSFDQINDDLKFIFRKIQDI